MDNLLIWIIIPLILVVAFGPVLYLLPSKKDRRLAALRAEALRQGLTVALRPAPKLDAPAQERVTAGGHIRTPTHASVCYSLPLTQTLDGVHPWRMLRAAAGWRADPGSAEMPGLTQPPESRAQPMPAPPPELRRQLLPLFDRLPSDTVAVDYSGHALGCYWLERFPAEAHGVANLKAVLVKVGDALVAFNAKGLQDPTDNIRNVKP